MPRWRLSSYPPAHRKHPARTGFLLTVPFPCLFRGWMDSIGGCWSSEKKRPNTGALWQRQMRQVKSSNKAGRTMSQPPCEPLYLHHLSKFSRERPDFHFAKEQPEVWKLVTRPRADAASRKQNQCSNPESPIQDPRSSPTHHSLLHCTWVHCAPELWFFFPCKME